MGIETYKGAIASDTAWDLLPKRRPEFRGRRGRETGTRRQQAKSGAMAFVALLAFGIMGCAATPPPPAAALSPDLRSLTTQVNEAVGFDPELAPVFVAFEPSGTERPDGEPFGRVISNGQAWARLTGPQRSHVMKKLAASFTRLFLKSPPCTADTVTIDVVTDKQRKIGWFAVQASKRNYTYHLSSCSGGEAADKAPLSTAVWRLMGGRSAGRCL